MLSLHPNARTTPAVRVEIARSLQPTGLLARGYGVSAETIRKWRKRGPEACLDRAIPAALESERRGARHRPRPAPGVPLDDLTFVITHFPPHLNRNAVSRILKAQGLGRLSPASHSRQPNGMFRDYDLGFVHIDVKHLPKLRAANGESRKRYLFVAIDRRSRSAHLAVKDDETERSAVAFLKEALRAFAFRIPHVLTDRGFCFTAEEFEAACRQHGVQHRKTRPYAPKTNGMAERFNGRIQREVLGITIDSHPDLEGLPRGFNQAYNARRQRQLGGLSPDEAVRQRLRAAGQQAP